jgi:hypothetical protein
MDPVHSLKIADAQVPLIRDLLSPPATVGRLFSSSRRAFSVPSLSVQICAQDFATGRRATRAVAVEKIPARAQYSPSSLA